MTNEREPRLLTEIMFKKLFSRKSNPAAETVKHNPNPQAPSQSANSKSRKSSANQNNPAKHSHAKSGKDSGQKPQGKAAASHKTHRDQAESGSDSEPRKKSNRRRGNRGGRNRRSSLQKQHESWSVDQFVVEPQEGKTRFHDLDLPKSLMHAIADLGFEYCSPIQAQVLPHTLDGYDAVGKAQTGTGKTAAFLLAAMYECLINPIKDERFIAEPRVVVLAPTRELVMQIAKDAEALGKYTGLNVVTLVGGMDYQKQLDRVNGRVVDIVAATPGRLIDFIQRGHINLSLTEVLVLDEADRMLDMGFLPQVRRIVRETPHREQRQTMLFSATFNYDVNTMIESWMVDPVRIEIEPENVAADTVEQKVYMVSSDEKIKVLKNIINSDDVSSIIVFANRRDQTRDVYESLKQAGIHCGILSGEISQQKRIKTLERFKSGALKVLVATDVAGRGIHIDDISHVVNYNLPEDPEDYVHRIGRTGRAGSTGISISLACEDDAFMLPDIEEMLGSKLKCEQPPADLLR